jgi:choline dehydrogenase-like flavoprotein
LSFLNERQYAVFAAICETLLPESHADDLDARIASHSAATTDVARRLLKLVERETSDGEKRQFTLLMRLFESRLANCLIAGRAASLPNADLATRTAVLRGWADSRLPVARQAFQSLKRNVLFLGYSSLDDGSANPAWSVFDYDRETATAEGGKPPLVDLSASLVAPVDTMTTDVLVIGSGAGGGVVAAELAAAGREVLVVEKGPFVSAKALAHDERQGQQRLYEKQGGLTTVDGAFVLLAGSALGGGTTVNWMTSLPAPPRVVDEWFDQFGLRREWERQWSASQSAVLERLGVSTEESRANRQNDLLERGCRELGYCVEPIPRNSRGCRDCSWCGFGCPFDAKQDARIAYLQHACADGAKLLVEADVRSIVVEAGRAVGAIVVAGQGESRREIRIRAKTVVVVAGSIHSPALLLRSGLTNRHIGRNLHLHPTTAVCAEFDEPVHSWRGAPQTRYSDHWANLDGRGHGVWMEVCPGHPGLWASALAWRSGDEHKRLMQRLDHLANVIVLNRDEHSGRVSIDRAGRPAVRYRLGRRDRSHLLRGTLEALRIQWAAGAKRVLSPHNRGLVCQRGEDFESFLASVARAGIRPNEFGLFSAHQMSTCRMASSAQLGCVDPSGQSFEAKNLYVADASVMPSACGVNPMISIMTLAHGVAGWIQDR